MTKTLLQFVDVNTSAKDFGEWLRLKRKQAMLSMEALGKKVGVSKQYISVLERAENHALTGKPVTPDREKVEALAKAVGGDVGEALNLAGFSSEKFRNLPDFLYRIDWQKFSPTALNEIKSFIEFKATYEALPLIKNGEVLQEDGELFVEFSEEEVLQLLVEEEKLHHKN
jgi:transcriptional regulator with XRE-family HTH domain